MNPIEMNLHLNFLFDFNQQRRLRLKYKGLRDASDPFDIPTSAFVKNYRLSQHMLIDLINEMEEFGEVALRSTKVPFHLQVLASLNFYAHGSYQASVGSNLLGPMSQASVSRALAHVSEILATHLLPRYVRFPVSVEEIHTTKQKFQDLLHFPNTIGAIDCTQIAIISPKVDDEFNPAVAYINRKGYHSINVQGICDANLMFINVNARYPGATHDAAIWETSTINRHLRERYEEGERNTWLIGDSGYPLQPFLMTPITDAAPNTPEANYTSRHSSARNCVERCFGVFKQRFRCMLRHRTLHYSHGAAGRIIYACVVLHNLCRTHNMPDVDEEEMVNEDNNFERQDALQPLQANLLEEGRLVRRRLVTAIANN